MISARMLRSMACLAWHEFPLVLPAHVRRRDQNGNDGGAWLGGPEWLEPLWEQNVC